MPEELVEPEEAEEPEDAEPPELPLLDDPEPLGAPGEPDAASSSEPGPPSLEAPSVDAEGNGSNFPPQPAASSSAAIPARVATPLPMAREKLAPQTWEVPAPKPFRPGGIIHPAQSGFRCQ